jgi:ankyrin repeat protein
MKKKVEEFKAQFKSEKDKDQEDDDHNWPLHIAAVFKNKILIEQILGQPTPSDIKSQQSPRNFGNPDKVNLEGLTPVEIGLQCIDSDLKTCFQ